MPRKALVFASEEERSAHKRALARQRQKKYRDKNQSILNESQRLAQRQRYVVVLYIYMHGLTDFYWSLVSRAAKRDADIGQPSPTAKSSPLSAPSASQSRLIKSPVKSRKQSSPISDPSPPPEELPVHFRPMLVDLRWIRFKDEPPGKPGPLQPFHLQYHNRYSRRGSALTWSGADTLEKRLDSVTRMTKMVTEFWGHAFCVVITPYRYATASLQERREYSWLRDDLERILHYIHMVMHDLSHLWEGIPDQETLECTLEVQTAWLRASAQWQRLIECEVDLKSIARRLDAVLDAGEGQQKNDNRRGEDPVDKCEVGDGDVSDVEIARHRLPNNMQQSEAGVPSEKHIGLWSDDIEFHGKNPPPQN